MRTNLTVPFAEKDAAKSLGARWDPALRVWYVNNVPDLAPFAQWMPRSAKADMAPPAPATRPAAITRAPRTEPLCDCDVLPWEPCTHTPTT